MTTKIRRYFTAKEKVALLRKHLIEGIPVSKICAENSLKPTVVYRWQKEFFENGDAAFERRKAPKADPRDKKIQDLEKKLAKRDEGIAELMMDHVRVKKKLGLL